MSAASQRRAAPARRLAATSLAAAIIAGCASDAPPPAQPTASTLYSPHAPAGDAAPAGEPAATAGITVTAPSGPTGRGALARRLPARFRGWRLSIAQVSPRHPAYLVTTLPPSGRRATLVTAARLLRAAARAFGDDPRAYRLLLPMSALAGAHRDPRAAAQAQTTSAGNAGRHAGLPRTVRGPRPGPMVGRVATPHIRLRRRQRGPRRGIA